MKEVWAGQNEQMGKAAVLSKQSICNAKFKLLKPKKIVLEYMTSQCSLRDFLLCFWTIFHGENDPKTGLFPFQNHGHSLIFQVSFITAINFVPSVIRENSCLCVVVFNHRSSDRVKTLGLVPLGTFVSSGRWALGSAGTGSAAGDPAQRFAELSQGCVDVALPEHLCCTGPRCCWWESQGEAPTQTPQSTSPWLALALLCFWLAWAEHFSAHSFLALVLVPRNSSQSP